jgi:gamma-glutamyl-gamma-aminobutyrate hydrolase PuuD
VSNLLIAGYSPWGAPSHNPIYPFDSMYDRTMNLLKAGEEDLKRCDVVILWGGSDISPTLYNEKPIPGSGPLDPTERDIFEWELIHQAKDFGIPIIGVCRGAQLLCAAAGGKLVQHTTGHTNTTHKISTHDFKHFDVSSDHHQMLYMPEGVEHEVLAWMPYNLSRTYLPENSEEGFYKNNQLKEPEVVFFDGLNALAIQCHPEWHQTNDPFNKWIEEIILERFF